MFVLRNLVIHRTPERELSKKLLLLCTTAAIVLILLPFKTNHRWMSSKCNGSRQSVNETWLPWQPGKEPIAGPYDRRNIAMKYLLLTKGMARQNIAMTQMRQKKRIVGGYIVLAAHSDEIILTHLVNWSCMTKGEIQECGNNATLLCEEEEQPKVIFMKGQSFSFVTSKKECNEPAKKGGINRNQNNGNTTFTFLKTLLRHKLQRLDQVTKGRADRRPAPNAELLEWKIPEDCGAIFNVTAEKIHNGNASIYSKWEQNPVCRVLESDRHTLLEMFDLRPVLATKRRILTSFIDKQEVPAKDSKVHMIVPVYGRKPQLKRFLANVKKEYRNSGRSFALTLVIQKHTLKASKNFVQQMEKVLRKEDFRIVLVGSGNFSLGRFRNAPIHQFNDSQILFFIDVDIAFDRQIFRNIRTHTVQGVSAYFPIFYSLYDPRSRSGKTLDLRLTREDGEWRVFGFGTVAIYKSDYVRCGMIPALNGWGLEDVIFAEEVADKGLKVVRAADPNMKHIYHRQMCSGPRVEMCKASIASQTGSVKWLADHLLGNHVGNHTTEWKVA